jgi:hypothetical protein
VLSSIMSCSTGDRGAALSVFFSYFNRFHFRPKTIRSCNLHGKTNFELDWSFFRSTSEFICSYRESANIRFFGSSIRRGFQRRHCRHPIWGFRILLASSTFTRIVAERRLFFCYRNLELDSAARHLGTRVNDLPPAARKT